ncbi:MAG: rod shape-determining protein [Pseudomonadota bacterium]
MAGIAKTAFSTGSLYFKQMIEKLIKSKTFYITIEADRLYLRCANDGIEIEINPTIVLNEKGKVVAVGNDDAILKAKHDKSYTIRNGFKHPRTCVCDFEAAEAALRYLIAKYSTSLTLVKPHMIIQPLEKTEGYITQIEARCLRELGESSGARQVYVWVGRKLQDHELLSLEFPATDGYRL